MSHGTAGFACRPFLTGRALARLVPAFFRAQKARCERLSLIANSIGALFSLSSLSQEQVDEAYLISPVVDLSATRDGVLTFDFAYGEYGIKNKTFTATVEVSTDGGKTWNAIWNFQDSYTGQQDSNYIISGSAFRMLVGDLFDLLAQYGYLRNRVLDVKTERQLARLQKNLSGDHPAIRRMYCRWGFAEDQGVTCYDILEAKLRRAHLTPYDPDGSEADYD